MIKVTVADKALSDYIRAKAGWACERCGAQHPPPTQGLHCSHYMGRGNWSTRFDPVNLSALCNGCHRYFTANPDLHREWMKAKIGEDALDDLRAKASLPAYGIKKRIKEIAAEYRAKLKAEGLCTQPG